MKAYLVPAAFVLLTPILVQAQAKQAWETNPELAFERAAFLALLDQTLRLDASVIGGPYHVGEEVKIMYFVLNWSRHTFTFHERLEITPEGGVQYYIERLDGDGTIANYPNPIAARRGRQYAAGGFPLPFPNPIEGGIPVEQTRKVQTTGFPPGKYRYVIEVNTPGVKTLVKAADFELLPPRETKELPSRKAESK